MVILWDLIRVKFNRREEGSKQVKKDLQMQHTSNPQTSVCELNSLYMLILKNKPHYLEELVVILEFLIVFNICMIFQDFTNPSFIIIVDISLQGLSYQSTTGWMTWITEMYRLTALEVRSPGWRCCWDWFALLAVKKSFSQASGLALAGGCLAALSTPQHVRTSPCFLSHLHMAFSLCMCLCSNLPILLGHQSYWIRPYYSNMISS